MIAHKDHAKIRQIKMTTEEHTQFLIDSWTHAEEKNDRNALKVIELQEKLDKIVNLLKSE